MSEHVEIIQNTATWDIIKSQRAYHFQSSDVYALVDVYATLTEDQQNELTLFRQTLRDLPQTYDDPNEAYRNYPAVPNFITIA